MLDKAIRELDRERIGLQNQEKKTIAEIKKMAKEGQMVCAAALIVCLVNSRGGVCTELSGSVLQDAVKVMAKSLIRNRHAVTKLHALKSQLQAVSLRIQVRSPAD